jgi:hypothetical protein
MSFARFWSSARELLAAAAVSLTPAVGAGAPTIPATFEQPEQYPVGIEHVLVNGISVLRDGEHTGAKPGKAVRGAAYVPR